MESYLQKMKSLRNITLKQVRRFGKQNKVPDLIIVPPDYHKYERFSKMARNIYLDYTDQVEPFGLDECWLDVTGSAAKGTA